MSEQNGVYIGSLNEAPALANDNDRILVVIGNKPYLITKANLIQSIGSLSDGDKSKLNAIVMNGTGTRVLNDKGQYVLLSALDGYHSHTNKDNVLDKLSVNENSDLLFDGKIIQANEQYVLPVATLTTLGGVKPDGTTITINEDGVISGASTYNLPTASEATLGGVKIDGDTIKINDGVISADVIGNWSAGNSYPVGYFVVYEQNLYECTTANNDSTWDESHWLLIESGTVINDWTANTEYNVRDLVIKDNLLIKCIESHTSTTEIDMTKWISLSGAKGEKGDKGDNGIDGVSPTATVTQTETGATITIIDKNGTTSADISNGYVDVNADCAILYATFLADNWSETAPYAQTAAVNSITAQHSPVVDIKYSEDSTLWNDELAAYSCLDKIETLNGFITAYCFNEKPTTDFTIKMKISGDITDLTFVTQDEFNTLYNIINIANTSLENTLNGGINNG